MKKIKRSSTTNRLLLTNIGVVVRVAARGQHMLRGASEMNDLAILEGDGPYAITVNGEGLIDFVGRLCELPAEAAAEAAAAAAAERVVDCRGCAVLPGLVDAHMHPIWAGNRVEEFKLKLAGASYMDIHRRGGGIGATVRATRAATDFELRQSLLERMHRSLCCGTTTAEVKSGYGLNAETELKMLRVANEARQEAVVEMSTTFLGAHSVPAEASNASAAARDVCEVQLPRVMEANVGVENFDVFIERNIFEGDDARRLLAAGAAAGLRLNVHGDELNACGAAEMAASIGATAVSHLEHISEEGVRAMAAAATVAVLLPTTAYMLRLTPPPARRLIDERVPVALGSDFNPNAHCFSMPLSMHLACVLMHMTLEEAVAAATLNAAASIGRGATHGSIEKGKVGDFIVLAREQWETLVYEFGGERDTIAAVIKRGHVVYEKAAATDDGHQ